MQVKLLTAILTDKASIDRLEAEINTLLGERPDVLPEITAAGNHVIASLFIPDESDYEDEQDEQDEDQDEA